MFPDGASWVGALDMAGNVWEWTADWYTNTYPSEAVIDPIGPDLGFFRVLRGGSWFNSSDSTHATYRNFDEPIDTNSALGFRCVMEITP